MRQTARGQIFSPLSLSIHAHFFGSPSSPFDPSTFVKLHSSHSLKLLLAEFFGFSEESEIIACVSMTSQLWGLVMTPLIPEFTSAIMLCHHFLAALVSFVALQYQYYLYYSVFYLALSEVSSLPLLVMSISKYFPPTSGSFHEILNDLAGPAFAVTFTYYRVYLWIKMTSQLWSDGVYVLSKKLSDQYRPGKNACLYLILLVCTLLSCLQLFWFTLIIREVLKLVGFDIPDVNPGFE
jgi:TLC domain.